MILLHDLYYTNPGFNKWSFVFLTKEMFQARPPYSSVIPLGYNVHLFLLPVNIDTHAKEYEGFIKHY